MSRMNIRAKRLGGLPVACAAARRIGDLQELDEINGAQQVAIVWCPVHRRYEAHTVTATTQQEE
jgi:hypothetical protein